MAELTGLHVHVVHVEILHPDLTNLHTFGKFHFQCRPVGTSGCRHTGEVNDTSSRPAKQYITDK